jgi:adenylyltransferase/sulfurtransferase
MPRFSDQELRRYARQMVLPQVGGIGQERLRAARVTARGEVEALYLAAAGVGTVFVPSDEIAETVRQVNPLVEVHVIPGEPAVEDVESQSLRALAALKAALGL